MWLSRYSTKPHLALMEASRDLAPHPHPSVKQRIAVLPRKRAKYPSQTGDPSLTFPQGLMGYVDMLRAASSSIIWPSSLVSSCDSSVSLVIGPLHTRTSRPSFVVFLAETIQGPLASSFITHSMWSFLSTADMGLPPITQSILASKESPTDFTWATVPSEALRKTDLGSPGGVSGRLKILRAEGRCPPCAVRLVEGNESLDELI